MLTVDDVTLQQELKYAATIGRKCIFYKAQGNYLALNDTCSLEVKINSIVHFILVQECPDSFDQAPNYDILTTCILLQHLSDNHYPTSITSAT